MKLKINSISLIPIFKSLSELTNEARLQFNETGLKIIELCPANVSLTEVVLNKEMFIQYELSKNEVFGIDVMNFLKIIKDLKKSDITITNTETSLILEYNGFKSEIPLIEIETEQKTIPNLEFNTEIKINSKTLKEILKTLCSLSESVKIEKIGDKVIFSSDKTQSVLYNDMEVLIKGENCLSRYSSEYLTKFIKNQISENVILRLGTDMPLSFEYEVKNFFSIKYILAPRVEYED